MHESDETMLARSGRTDPDGKCTARITVPMTEEMHDDIVCRASLRKRPKAEYVRELLEGLLANEGCIEIPVTPELQAALDGMAAKHRMPTAEFLRDHLERMVLREFASMQLRIAETGGASPLTKVSGLPA